MKQAVIRVVSGRFAGMAVKSCRMRGLRARIKRVKSMLSGGGVDGNFRPRGNHVPALLPDRLPCPPHDRGAAPDKGSVFTEVLILADQGCRRYRIGSGGAPHGSSEPLPGSRTSGLSRAGEGRACPPAPSPLFFRFLFPALYRAVCQACCRACLTFASNQTMVAVPRLSNGAPEAAPTKRGFPLMVGCAGAASAAPFRWAVVLILCHPATRSLAPPVVGITRTNGERSWQRTTPHT